MKRWLQSIRQKKRSRGEKNIAEYDSVCEDFPRHNSLNILNGMMSRPEFERAVDQIAADGEAKGCLMLADVDRLGEINDRYGQEAGDRVLEHVCHVLQDSLGEGDGMCRVKSGEFALWLTGATAEDAADIRRKIAEDNDNLLHPPVGIQPVSVSVGAVFLKEACQESEHRYKCLYRQAGKAERMVKAGGRCGFAVYQDRDVCG
ncbi:MAG: GGDEF domain-containing protein [Lachnospiraceae bacterium]|nr:GGDEF domain-containing protein [Lachnospiraceae bacterium]